MRKNKESARDGAEGLKIRIEKRGRRFQEVLKRFDTKHQLVN